MYAVVEFVEERTVEVVPVVWLSKTEKQEDFSYWPSKGVRQKAKSCELPDKENWGRFRVRIFTKKDTYQDAVAASEAACDTSNVDDIPVGKLPSKRPHKPTGRLVSEDECSDDGSFSQKMKKSSKLLKAPDTTGKKGRRSQTVADAVSDTDSDDDENVSSHKKRKTSTLPQPSDFLHNEAQERRSLSPIAIPSPIIQSTSNPRTPDPPFGRTRDGRYFSNEGQESITSFRETPTSSRNISHSKDTRFQQQVLQRLDVLIDEQREHTRLLRQVHAVLAPVKDEEIAPNPMTSPDQLEAMCTRLEEGKHRKALLQYLCSIGGNSVGDEVRRIMRRLMTNELMSQYSLKGKAAKGKAAKTTFDKTAIYRVVVQAVQRNKKCGEREVAARIGETLTLAPFRGSSGKKDEGRNEAEGHEADQEEV